MAVKTVATNRKAYHNYHIGESVEAGIVLAGTEIKSIRAGRANLGDAYVRVEGGELWLVNAHIARYEAASYLSHEPMRQRKLLLHRKQINSLASKVLERGLRAVLTQLVQHLTKSRAIDPLHLVGQHLAPGHTDAFANRVGLAPVGFGDPTQVILVAAQDGQCAIAGSAVNDDVLQARTPLQQHRANSLLDERPLVVRGRDDADPRPG